MKKRLIERIAERLGASYLYDDFARINLRADAVKHYPLIVETLPAEGSIDLKLLPRTKVIRNIIVAFLVPCELDFDGAQVDKPLNAMIDLATRFLSELAKVSPDSVPNVITYNAVLDFLDANLVGVRITLNVSSDYNCYGKDTSNT